ncbi:ABC transporter permease [Anaerobranca gottschalkii]|uniref:ABC-type transport system involved in multi-copper enzyme maturation, permease component n=1 Tax=Anaerobranca gottschalkii DSM 13577 TaxID=1120990 RepID=A0A1H9ZW19_9FIRM|nr:ABC transporter permease subunit [Anaerobranca gottschalkii]SES85993.1 ABC-type transport system involved in multi-copper enzyme maturation, permease component [Anaerobranca gottschalkii DSM 13577]
MPKLTTLIGLEISKMLHKKRILFGLSFLILVYILMAFGISTLANFEQSDNQIRRAFLEEELKFYQEQLNRTGISEEEKEHLKGVIEDIQLQLDLGYEKAREIQLKRELETVNNIIADESLPPEVRESYKAYKEILEAKIQYGENSVEVRKLEYKQRLKDIEETLANEQNLTPVEKRRLESEQRELQLRMEQSTVDNQWNAFSLLLNYIVDTSSFFLPLIIILVASEAISGEYSLGTIKLLLIKPVTRMKLYISKYIALMLYGVFVFFFISVVGYFIGGFFVGFGGFFDTRIVGGVNLGREFGYMIDYSSAYLITNFRYYFQILFLLLIVMAVFIAFSMLISVFTKSATISLVATMGLIIFGSIISGIFSQYSWSKYLLMPHFDLLRHLEGRFMYSGVSLNFSIAVIVIYTVIFMVAGIVSFKEKDIL